MKIWRQNNRLDKAESAPINTCWSSVMRMTTFSPSPSSFPLFLFVFFSIGYHDNRKMLRYLKVANNSLIKFPKKKFWILNFRAKFKFKFKKKKRIETICWTREKNKCKQLDKKRKLFVNDVFEFAIPALKFKTNKRNLSDRMQRCSSVGDSAPNGEIPAHSTRFLPPCSPSLYVLHASIAKLTQTTASVRTLFAFHFTLNFFCFFFLIN